MAMKEHISMVCSNISFNGAVLEQRLFINIVKGPASRLINL